MHSLSSSQVSGGVGENDPCPLRAGLSPNNISHRCRLSGFTSEPGVMPEHKGMLWDGRSAGRGMPGENAIHLDIKMVDLVTRWLLKHFSFCLFLYFKKYSDCLDRRNKTFF